jgi:hypothetical protein
MGRRTGWELDYARYAAATWQSARWGVLLTASATHQLVRRASYAPGSARDRIVRARGALVRARDALAQRGVSMLTLSACAGLCIALGAFAPVEVVRWLAACALCAAIVVREHARETQAEALRARIDNLETRIAAAQRSASVELVDVELLDEEALVTARARCLALASEASDELDVRRAFSFGSTQEPERV